MSAEPLNERSIIEYVEKWRLSVIGEEKELENALFVQFSSIVGTLCTFAITVHTIVLALPIAHKYVLLGWMGTWEGINVCGQSWSEEFGHISTPTCTLHRLLYMYIPTTQVNPLRQN